VDRVADEHHAAVPPDVLFDPLDGRAMDLLVGRERGEIVLHAPPKVTKCAQAGPPPLDRVAAVRPGHVPEAVGVSVAHRAEPEEAAVAQPELQRGQAPRPDRRQTAPDHLPGVDRGKVAQRERAHAGGDAVGAHDQVVRPQ
jgi:hypothetical protein